MKTNRILTRCSLFTLAAAALTSVGCSTVSDSRHAGDISSLRDNPTPALHTMANRETDRFNEITVSNETNLRMMIEDIDRTILYTNRPSHLSRFPSKH